MICEVLDLQPKRCTPQVMQGILRKMELENIPFSGVVVAYQAVVLLNRKNKSSFIHAMQPSELP